MLLIAYSFQNLKLEFDNYTSRKFDIFMKIQVYEWQPFYAIIPIVTCPLVPCSGRRGEANELVYNISNE